MNQYYRNNEMEILDPGIRHSQYPYAQNQRATLQSMNYKDWMNMCTSRESEELSLSAQTGVVTGTAIISFLLSVPFPVAAAATGIISLLIPFLWPEEAGAPGTTEAQFTWEQLMSAVEGLVGSEISNLVRTDAINTLAKLQSSIRDYQQAVCNLKDSSPEDPDYENYKSDVRREFNDAEDQAKYAIIDLKRQGYETLLLASYAQAANVHLLLLRDVVQYGQSWGFSAREVEQYYSNPSLIGNPGMLELLAIYTEYCIKWYNTGLQGQQNTNDWNKFNNFRRDMTIMVLDLVALWPTFNPRYYPLPTKSQLTRTLYTSLFKRQRVEQSVPDLERLMIDPPSLFRWLRQLNFHIISQQDGNYISGMKQYYQGTLSNDLYDTGFKGVDGNIIESLNVSKPESQDDVWSILMRSATTSPYTGQLYSFRFKFTQSLDQLVTVQTSVSEHSSSTFGLLCKSSESNTCNPCDPNNPCTNEITNTSNPCNDKSLYSHRFSYMAPYFGTYGVTSFWYGCFGWTHVSVDAKNLIDTEKITQIPAVKGYQLKNTTRVIKGPGSTGGDLVELLTNEMSGTLRIRVTQPGNNKGYRMRIRYANNTTTKIEAHYYVGYEGDTQVHELPATYTGNSLSYNSFSYKEVLYVTPQDTESVAEVLLGIQSGTGIIIDKIEFIPIEGSVEEYETTQSLENARKAVNALFTKNAKNALRMDVTDYDVDQAANKVDCMSDDRFPKEKMMLRDQVKHAKRLSQARNLLNYGDFESPDWSNANGWKVSNSVTVQAGHPISRGRYLDMPGGRSIKFSDTLYPTYAYQKVDESKLKPYTRYLVRGFVGSAKDLELFVTRYGKEVHDKMNIPFRLMNTWTPTNRVSNSCGTGQVSGYTMSSDPCQTNTYATNSSGMQMASINGYCEDKQHFVFHIDVGEIYPRSDLGVGVGFKISSPSGMAELDNIEVIEANPLTGEALARVKKREQKWKREMEQKCALTEKTVSVAQQAVDRLFTDARKNRLKVTTTMQDILNAEKKVNHIPYVQNPYFEDIPGVNSIIFQFLQSDVQTALELYTRRNMIRNGDFSSGLSNWHTTAGANVQERDGDQHVLVISQWDANVSQEVCVEPERGYVLRVTAKKEGSGKGYVTLSDCTEENTETMTFTSDEMLETQRPPVRPERLVEPGICDMAHSSESLGFVPETNIMMDRKPEEYATGSCSCGCGNTIHTPSTSYEAKAYPSGMSSMNRFSSGYITKTIEVFPETNRMRIEIGETEGTFLIYSIELICMED
ncbi:insecticidal delta-endotoxin Cry8Ea1 family protein [Bacillus toyonensis]|uniref:insecticidal delta-endotoxin Cry8Ea1 family protein n=1 Tax=Bacillus toyonensis TaxID=155322 RepID=UPI003D241E16